jgi:hypothetical protein
MLYRMLSRIQDEHYTIWFFFPPQAEQISITLKARGKTCLWNGLEWHGRIYWLVVVSCCIVIITRRMRTHGRHTKDAKLSEPQCQDLKGYWIQSRWDPSKKDVKMRNSQPLIFLEYMCWNFAFKIQVRLSLQMNSLYHSQGNWYIPSKPVKYGTKLWILCDDETYNKCNIHRETDQSAYERN